MCKINKKVERENFMEQKTKELVKKLAESLINEDPKSLICFLIAEKKNANMLNDNIKLFIKNQSNKDIKDILEALARDLAKMISNLTSEKELNVLDEVKNYLNEELQQAEIDSKMVEPVVNNMEHYILQYIWDTEPLYHNDLILERRLTNLEKKINRDSYLVPVIEGMHSLHIDSILDTDIDKTEFREQEISDIRRRMEDKGSSILFLTGDPGIGKTTLARLYANRCERKKIYFVKYQGSFEKTLNELSIKRKKDSWKEVLRYWKSLSASEREQILLIIDNFNDDSIDALENCYYEALNTELFNELKNLGIQILITTRINREKNVYIVKGVKNPVGLFEAYYKNELNDQQKKGAEKLITLLHNNTLMLALCAGLLREECSLNKLIVEIQKCNVKIKKILLEKEADFQSAEKRQRFTLYEQAEAILNMGAILKVETNCQILSNMALLPLSGMKKREFLQFIHKDSDEGRNHIKTLILRSWIIEEDHIVCLHPVIREILLDKGKKLVSWDRCRDYCSSLNDKIDLYYAFQDRMCYKYYAEEVYTIFHDIHDMILGELFYNLSDIYDQIGNPKNSRELIDIVSTYLDEMPESKKKVRMYSGVAYSYNNQADGIQDLDNAANLLERAKNMLGRIKSQCTDWDYYSELGRICSNQGSNELARITGESDWKQIEKHALRALAFHQQALEQREQALEIAYNKDEKVISKRDVATSYTGIATSYFKLHCYKDSVQMHRNALEIREDCDIGRMPISQQAMLGSTLQWYDQDGFCDLITFKEELEFYPKLLEKNIQQENKRAFDRNVLFFDKLCEIINKEDNLSELKPLAKTKKQEIELLEWPYTI